MNYKDQCVPWAWYLANDFQFFIAGMLVLVIYRFSSSAAMVVSVLMSLCGVVATAVIAHEYDITLTKGDSQNHIYDKPYTRVSPYGIGLVTALIVSSRMRPLQQLNRRVGAVLTLLSLLIICIVVYITANFNWNNKHPNWSTSAQWAYMALSRFAFTCGVALLVMMCSAGHGGPANWVLTLNFWEPFAKLTFAAYLIHPALIRVAYYQNVHLFHYSAVEIGVYYCGFLLLAYAAAVVLFVLVEQPFANLTKALTKGR
jgi:peptidoglycan/LPS O-acetylase OafA/YrhL